MLDWESINDVVSVGAEIGILGYAGLHALRDVAKIVRFFKNVNNKTDDKAKHLIAEIYIDGVIATQQVQLPTLPGQGKNTKITNPESVEERVKEALKNKKVKGFIFSINSPGGTPVAADEMGDYISRIELPTIAYAREQATSASYWVAAACDKIVANELSMIGSIGVITNNFDFSDLIENLGIKKRDLKAGKYKDLGSPFRKMTDEERGLLQDRLDDLHQIFIKKVANYRNLSVEDVTELATGMVYSSADSLKYGLIDEIGNKRTAQKILEEMVGIKDTAIVSYKERVFPFQ